MKISKDIFRLELIKPIGAIHKSLILRSIRNIGRKKFRMSLVLIFLSLIIGLLVIMVQISATSSQKYAELETRIENTIELRPVGSLGVGGVRIRTLGEIRR